MGQSDNSPFAPTHFAKSVAVTVFFLNFVSRMKTASCHWRHRSAFPFLLAHSRRNLAASTKYSTLLVEALPHSLQHYSGKGHRRCQMCRSSEDHLPRIGEPAPLGGLGAPFLVTTSFIGNVRHKSLNDVIQIDVM